MNGKSKAKWMMPRYKSEKQKRNEKKQKIEQYNTEILNLINWFTITEIALFVDTHFRKCIVYCVRCWDVSSSALLKSLGWLLVIVESKAFMPHISIWIWLNSSSCGLHVHAYNISFVQWACKRWAWYHVMQIQIVPLAMQLDR